MNTTSYHKKTVGTPFEEKSQWFLSDVHMPEGVVLLIHGLNQKPSSWKDMIRFLNSLGMHVYRLTLKGHGGTGFEDMLSITTESWRNDFYEGYRQIDNRFPRFQKFLVSYSIGSLVALEYQMLHKTNLFDKQILLAPALSIRFYVYAIKPFTSVFSHIPSRSPKNYRANHQGTSMAAYHAFFYLFKQFHANRVYREINVKTLVLSSPQDELINFNGLKKIKRKYDLSNWRIQPVLNRQSELKVSYHHLIIDAHVLGSIGWDVLTTQVSAFFYPEN